MDANFSELQQRHGQNRTIFQTAFDQLYQSFNEKDKALYTSATLEDVLLKIHDLDSSHAASNTSRKFGRRLQPILYNLDRYGRAFDTLAQVQATPTSLIWGALRIIVEAAGSFITYFEKLVSMIEDLATCFSLYRQYEELLGHDPRLDVALGRFYYHMLILLSKAKNVFVTRGYKIFFRNVWKSFEMDFKAISGAIARDTSILNEEITLSWRKKLSSKLVLSSCNNNQTAQKVGADGVNVLVEKRQKVMEWLMPADMASILLRESQRRIHVSAQWLSSNSTFQDWISSFDRGRLWIHGLPGSGKTVLSTSIIERVQQRFENDSDVVTAYCFCNRSENFGSDLEILSTVMGQILTQTDEIPTPILDACNTAIQSGRSRITPSDQPAYLLRVLASPKSLNLIIDGLDESASPTTLLKTLNELQCSVPSTRVAYLSRDLFELRNCLKDFAQIKLTEGLTKPDIDGYLSYSMAEICPEDVMLRDQMQQTLSKSAGGMFIWANLMVKTLRAATSTFEMKNIMAGLPNGLNAMYESILRNVANQSQERQRLARRILLWTCYSQRPLRWNELQYAVAISESKEVCASKMPFKRAVLELCSPLIEYSEETDTFRPVHLSVCEFLCQQAMHAQHPEDIRQFLLEPSEAHLEMARSCLACISMANVAYHTDIENATVPLVNYATMFWCVHLTKSRFCTRGSQEALGFLSCQQRRRIWIARFLFLHTTEFPLQRLLSLQRGLSVWVNRASGNSDTTDRMDWIQDTTQLLIRPSVDSSSNTPSSAIAELRPNRTRISHFEKLMVIRDLSREYTMSGRLTLGERWLTDALERQRETTGPQHPSTAWLLNSLGIVYDQQKRVDEAISVQEQALAVQEAEHGRDHLESIWTVNELGRLYRHAGQYSKAEANHLRALNHLKSVLQPNDLQIAWTLNTLARTIRKQSRFNAAILMHREAIGIQKVSLEQKHPHILWAMSDIARCHRDHGELAESATIHREVLQGREQTLGREHADTLWSVNDLGIVLSELGETEEALALHQRAYLGQVRLLGEDHEHTLWTKSRIETFCNGNAN